MRQLVTQASRSVQLHIIIARRIYQQNRMFGWINHHQYIDVAARYGRYFASRINAADVKNIWLIDINSRRLFRSLPFHANSLQHHQIIVESFISFFDDWYISFADSCQLQIA